MKPSPPIHSHEVCKYRVAHSAAGSTTLEIPKAYVKLSKSKVLISVLGKVNTVVGLRDAVLHKETVILGHFVCVLTIATSGSALGESALGV